jgi:Flp pilus assembly pilin Flp
MTKTGRSTKMKSTIEANMPVKNAPRKTRSWRNLSGLMSKLPKTGASLLEYSFLVGLIAVGAIVVTVSLGNGVATVFITVKGTMTDYDVENGGANPTFYNFGMNGEKLPTDPMVMEFNTAAATIYPMAGGAITVDWGNATANANCGQDFTAGAPITCNYPAFGDYQVSISGDMTHYGDHNGRFTNADIVRVSQWGKTGLTRLDNAFRGATNLTDVPNSLPATVTSIVGTFQDASALNDSDIASWNTSNVERVASAFRGAASFNMDLPWQTANFTDIQGVFRDATSFDGDLSTWKNAQPTSIKQAFTGATSFTGKGLENWNVSKVKDFSSVFTNTQLAADLSAWETPAAESFASAFYNVDTVDFDFSGWDTSKVTNFSKMFQNSDSITGQGVGGWDVSSATNMTEMFANALTMGEDLSGWCVAQFPSEPTNFDNGTPSESTPGYSPNWGAACAP